MSCPRWVPRRRDGAAGHRHDACAGAVIRVAVVDDQALVRGGFRAILAAEPDIDIVGEAGTGGEAVEVVAATSPDVVLMDVRMPEMDRRPAVRQSRNGQDPRRAHRHQAGPARPRTWRRGRRT